ncbi:MAG: hypothetical protein WCG19_10440, partial [Chlorobiaceae bacterium]
KNATTTHNSSLEFNYWKVIKNLNRILLLIYSKKQKNKRKITPARKMKKAKQPVKSYLFIGPF